MANGEAEAEARRRSRPGMQRCSQDATRSTACGCALISSQGRGSTSPPVRRTTNTTTLVVLHGDGDDGMGLGMMRMGSHPTGTAIAFSAMQWLTALVKNTDNTNDFIEL